MTASTPTDSIVGKTEALTLFRIFETEDGGFNWKFVGSVSARDRDHAERLFYGDRELEFPVQFAAVSESAWKPRTRSPLVVKRAETTDLAMPLIGTVVTPDLATSTAAQTTLTEVPPLAEPAAAEA